MRVCDTYMHNSCILQNVSVCDTYIQIHTYMQNTVSHTNTPFHRLRVRMCALTPSHERAHTQNILRFLPIFFELAGVIVYCGM
eukprot:c29792_g1_i1 orf=150-398(+)